MHGGQAGAGAGHNVVQQLSWVPSHCTILLLCMVGVDHVSHGDWLHIVLEGALARCCRANKRSHRSRCVCTAVRGRTEKGLLWSPLLPSLNCFPLPLLPLSRSSSGIFRFPCPSACRKSTAAACLAHGRGHGSNVDKRQAPRKKIEPGLGVGCPCTEARKCVRAHKII